MDIEIKYLLCGIKTKLQLRRINIRGIQQYEYIRYIP